MSSCILCLNGLQYILLRLWALSYIQCTVISIWIEYIWIWKVIKNIQKGISMTYILALLFLSQMHFSVFNIKLHPTWIVRYSVTVHLLYLQG